MNLLHLSLLVLLLFPFFFLRCTSPPISVYMPCTFREMENSFVDGISSTSHWLAATPVILTLHIKCRFLVKHHWLVVLLWQRLNLSCLLLYLLLNAVALEVTVHGHPIFFKWFSYKIIFSLIVDHICIFNHL